jgi:acyl-CoA synthetase (NDP forming)
MVDPGLAAENPLDTGPTVGVQAQKFTEICKVVCADPTVDLVTVQGLIPVNPTDAYNPAPLRGVFDATSKPVLAFGRIAQNATETSRKFQAETGVPFIHGLPETIRALQNLVRYAGALQSGPAALDAPGSTRPPEGGALDVLLAQHGLTPPRAALAASPEEAAARAAEIGFPVAVKIVSAQASHKTEVDGVALHLASGEAVRTAAAAMALRLKAHDAHATVDGFLVQEMVDGVEMLVGVREDPQFGPLMAVGLGGVAAEVLQDVAIRLLPIDHATAADMLFSLKGAPLLGAFRGRPERDGAALTQAMIGLSRLFMAYRPWWSDIEVNPLIVRAKGDGVRAVDVRIVPRRGEVA